jgi:hypothetical protein
MKTLVLAGRDLNLPVNAFALRIKARNLRNNFQSRARFGTVAPLTQSSLVPAPGSGMANRLQLQTSQAPANWQNTTTNKPAPIVDLPALQSASHVLQDQFTRDAQSVPDLGDTFSTRAWNNLGLCIIYSNKKCSWLPVFILVHSSSRRQQSAISKESTPARS